jgi:hypothetical protein
MVVAIPINKTIKIVNEYSELVLAVEDEATTEGARIEQHTDTGGDHQRWRLKPAGPGNVGFYNIENVHSAMSLEVVGSSTDPGAEIVQRPYGNGPPHRQWTLVQVPGKTYKIENRNSGLVLDDVAGQTQAPTPVKQDTPCDDDDGRQQWKLITVPTPATPSSIPAPAPVNPTPAPTPTPAPVNPTPAATPTPALAAVLKYGDKVHLQNGYANWQGGYMHTRNPDRAPWKYLVYTSDSKNRDDDSGTWEIVSATGKAAGAEVLILDNIRLRNLYGGNGGYLDVVPPGDPLPYKRVSTCDSANRDRSSGDWGIYEASPRSDSKVREGDPIHLRNGFNNWQGGYLDTRSGYIPAGQPSKYIVYTSDSDNRDGGSGTWRLFKAT